MLRGHWRANGLPATTPHPIRSWCRWKGRRLESPEPHRKEWFRRPHKRLDEANGGRPDASCGWAAAAERNSHQFWSDQRTHPIQWQGHATAAAAADGGGISFVAAMLLNRAAELARGAVAVQFLTLRVGAQARQVPGCTEVGSDLLGTSRVNK